MLQNSGDHHREGIKPRKNHGINYQPQLVQDFWTINSNINLLTVLFSVNRHLVNQVCFPLSSSASRASINGTKWHDCIGFDTNSVESNISPTHPPILDGKPCFGRRIFSDLFFQDKWYRWGFWKLSSESPLFSEQLGKQWSCWYKNDRIQQTSREVLWSCRNPWFDVFLLLIE